MPDDARPAGGESLEVVALRSQLRPLGAELESRRVDALMWRARAARLESELVAVRRTGSAPEHRSLVARAVARLRRDGSPPEPDQLPDDYDPAYYRARYTDLAGLSDERLLAHWSEWGRPEGRRARALFPDPVLPELAAGGPVVVLFSPDAGDRPSTRLAAILAEGLAERYRVVLVVDGPIDAGSALVGAATAVIATPPSVFADDFESSALAQAVADRYSPSWAVLSTSASRGFSTPLELRGVPTIALISELAEDVTPRGELANLVGAASSIVFPSLLAARSALREHAFLRGRVLPIVRQPVLPASDPGTSATTGVDDDEFVVLGAGGWHPRAGVELFLAVAEAMEDVPGRRLRFVWVGPELGDQLDYADVVREQARRGRLPTRFTHVPSGAGLATWLERADAVLHSARMEAITDEAIRAALQGVPVVAFEGASGLAEVLAADDGLVELVVPYVDVDAAAAVLSRLINDAPRRRELGRRAATVVADAFDAAGFVSRIESLAEDAAEAVRQADADAAYLAGAGRFNPDFYWGPRGARPDGDLVRRHYVHTSRLSRPRARPLAGLVGRRGLEGFHPLIWSEEHPGDDPVDPLVTWDRAGRPSGRWTHEVLRVAPGDRTEAMHSSLRIVVHGHFFFPDALPDLLVRLRRTAFAWRLLLTTDTEEKADALRAVARAHGIDDAEILIVPNRGRDLGPLLTGIGEERLADADVVLHVHGKKSAHAGDGAGETWRDFLWGSLIAGGDGLPAIGDTVIAAFTRDPGLGLVFPEDPNLHDWDDNRPIADLLLPRIGVSGRVPQHFEFPQGGMFWARVDALRPLLALRLGWGDYPDEPLPVDGTLLHALERLIAFSSASRGFAYATSAVSGVTR